MSRSRFSFLLCCSTKIPTETVRLATTVYGNVRSTNEPPAILATIGLVTELRSLHKVSIKCMSVMLWFGHYISFFLNLSQVSYKASVWSFLKLLISSLKCILLEGRKNLSSKAPFNCLQLVIESSVRLFTHNIANLNQIAFWPTLGLLKNLQMVTKFTICKFGSSLGRPPNNPFRLRSWIIVLVMLKFYPGSNDGEIIAPIAPAPSIPSSSSFRSYWIGRYSCLSQNGRFLLILHHTGTVICSARLGLSGFSNSSSPKFSSSGFGCHACFPAFCIFTLALAKATSLSAFYCSAILLIRCSSELGGYGSTIGDNKILKIHNPNEGSKVPGEIFMLKSGSWRTIYKFPHGIISWTYGMGSALALVSNAFHWVSMSGDYFVVSRTFYLVSFSISNEVYSEIPLPK
ncbi:hypothetical protein BC332_20571 [Capsicum chinense]|nr:hypothetical protein BC332_20571 [Capsicum chinense]